MKKGPSRMPLKLDDAQLKCGPDTTVLPIGNQLVTSAPINGLHRLKHPILRLPHRVEIALINDSEPVHGVRLPKTVLKKCK